MQKTQRLKKRKSTGPHDEFRTSVKHACRSNNNRNQQRKNPKNFDENKIIAKQGETIAGNTRKEIEAKTGKKIVSKQNAKQLKSGKGRIELE